MLTEVIRLKRSFHAPLLCRPLCHQLQPQLLRLLERHPTISRRLASRTRYFRSTGTRLWLGLSLSPPRLLLRRHVARRADAVVRIHQPENKKSSVTRPRLVDQFEWLDFVLERIGEGEEAALGRGDGTYVLEWCFFAKTARSNAENFSQGGMVIFKGSESVSLSLSIHSAAGCCCCT